MLWNTESTFCIPDPMFVQSDDSELIIFNDFDGFIDLFHKDAEFGKVSGGHSFIAVAVFNVGIETQADIRPRELFAEAFEFGD